MAVDDEIAVGHFVITGTKGEIGSERALRICGTGRKHRKARDSKRPSN
jgi:hypothetical protein